MADHVRWTFGDGPAPEVIRYFKEKQLTPSFDWRDVWAEEHAIAFTVAKSAGFDVLEDIHEELSRAIEEGLPFAEFRKRLEPRLRAKGWWGRQEVIDPASGEVVTAQLGSRRRLKVIYEANMRSARAAGQWERAQRTKRMLPYFAYRLGPSRQHRAQHVAWASAPTILPVDDPFWDTHYPPNGWGCKCWLRQISRREAQRLGGPTESPQIQYRNWINRRTGRMEKIPVGIDPGWHSNPGKARARKAMGRFFERLEKEGGKAAEAAMRDFWHSDIWRAWVMMERSRVHMPVALLPVAAEALQSSSPMVSISNDTLAAKVRKHVDPKKALPAVDENDPDAIRRREREQQRREHVYRSLQALLRDWPRLMARGQVLKDLQPGAVWIIVEADGLLWRIVVRKSRNGYMHVQTLHPTDRKHLHGWLKKKK